MAKRHSDYTARRDFLKLWQQAVRVLTGDCWGYHKFTGEYVQTYTGRQWFIREYRKYRFHPAVDALIETWEPDNWQRLLLEWPHVSATDPNRLAYTASERHGIDDRQTITTIGKYLVRHFKGVPDHDIRDIVARFTYSGSISITDDLDEMIHAVINGPRSCMSSRFNLRCTDGEQRHPYAVYDPAYGWRMAIRKNGDEILGRCLLHEDGDARGFVRSYKLGSGVDEAIEAYLKNLGYEKFSEWPDGAQLGMIETRRGGYLMPYIDGDTQSVSMRKGYFVIDSGGEYSASITSGYIEDGEECSCCGGLHHEGFTVGYHFDAWVGNCCEDQYTYAYGRNGNEYYVHNDNVVEVDGEYYDVDYLCDNNIVEDVDGDYQHVDNVIYIESEEAYYPDDRRICYAEDTERYELREDCWRCEESRCWYTNDTEYVEVDDKKYHPDNVPDAETTDMVDEENSNAE